MTILSHLNLMCCCSWIFFMDAIQTTHYIVISHSLSICDDRMLGQSMTAWHSFYYGTVLMHDYEHLSFVSVKEIVSSSMVLKLNFHCSVLKMYQRQFKESKVFEK